MNEELKDYVSKNALSADSIFVILAEDAESMYMEFEGMIFTTIESAQQALALVKEEHRSKQAILSLTQFLGMIMEMNIPFDEAEEENLHQETIH